jgi:hypothetical protein
MINDRPFPLEQAVPVVRCQSAAARFDDSASAWRKRDDRCKFVVGKVAR